MCILLVTETNLVVVFFKNTPGVTRTLNLRIWNPLLCQLSYRRLAPIGAASLSLDLVKRMLS
jgi:hypothetical protein